jgi:hypothetical protein
VAKGDDRLGAGIGIGHGLETDYAMGIKLVHRKHPHQNFGRIFLRFCVMMQK